MFITVEDAETILGSDFGENEAEKKRLVMLSNIWCKKYVGGDIDYETEATDDVKTAACEIIIAIKKGSVFGGQERETTEESVSAGSVSSTEKFSEGSIAVSSEEQIAMAILDDAGFNLKSSSIVIPVWRA